MEPGKNPNLLRLLHTFLIKDANWIFMFAERVLIMSVGSRAETGRISSSFFPLSSSSKSTGHRGWGCGGEGSNRILAAQLLPLEPACVLLEAFPLFSAPRVLSPHPRQLGRGGDGGSWVRLWEKRRRQSLQILQYITAQKRARNAASGWKQQTVPGSLARWDSPESKDLAGKTRVDSEPAEGSVWAGRRSQ